MKFSHFAMGTTFEIVIAGQKEPYARQAAEAVFDEIDRLEGILSRFDPGSDVGQLSRLKPGQHLRVGIELIECVRIAAEAYACTNGAFDVTIGALLQSPEEEGITFRSKEASICRGFDRVRFGGKGDVFFYPRPVGNRGSESADSGCLQLDFGGIGKGYALDKTLDILADWDVSRAFIHAGTSTALAIGDSPKNPPGEMGWPVGAAGDTIYLHNMALSGSGKEVKGEHILDPSTGEPARGHRSAWVTHPSAAMADALSTAFIVMQFREVKKFCDSNPGIWAKVIEPAGTIKTYNPAALRASGGQEP